MFTATTRTSGGPAAEGGTTSATITRTAGTQEMFFLYAKTSWDPTISTVCLLIKEAACACPGTVICSSFVSALPPEPHRP
jgi:hypothetical protein